MTLTHDDFLRFFNEDDFLAICKKHHINRRRCGLCNFEREWDKLWVYNLLREAEHYPGCIEEVLYYLNMDKPLKTGESFLAILHIALEGKKEEAAEIEQARKKASGNNTDKGGGNRKKRGGRI